jgi:hypothetical protein
VADLCSSWFKNLNFMVAKEVLVDIIYIMNEKRKVCSVFTAVTGFSLLLRR